MVAEVALGWALPAGLFVAALVLLYIYGNWTYNVWKQQGIPGPKPVPFWGNAKQFQRTGVFQSLEDWAKEYGQTYGFYFLRQPMLVTADIDILKEIFIKDFNNFVTRARVAPLQRAPFDKAIVNVSGEVWRRQRHTLTPSFTASKLKQMSRFINRCCENLVAAITKHANEGKPLDVKTVFGSYTLDVIAGTGFSFETNSLEDKDENKFLSTAKSIFDDNGQMKFSVILAMMFPALEPFLKMLGCCVSKKLAELDFIEQTLNSIIEERKRDKGNHAVDLTQLMLEAEATEEHIMQNPNEKSLTRDEIMAQGFVLFLAGYETTGTTLQYLSYLLAMNPDVQEKLHDEIVAAVGDEDLCYENVMKISYLENCIYETLRMYPPVGMFGRQALESRTYKGVHIPAGSEVVAPVGIIMKDEQFFPEPEKFNPDRYEDGGCSSHVPTMIKEMPFGCGPRQCIGMRLALYEAKMAVAAVVRKIKFVKIPQTPEKFNIKVAILSAPDTTILVGTELRQ